MIIPTPEYNPLFADDGEPFREKMIAYIQREFGDLLGPRAALLKTEAGLKTLAEQTRLPARSGDQSKAA